jgi:hypothetical protein
MKRSPSGPSRGQYRKETLIARFGSEMLMPDMRHLIAQCLAGWRVYYSDLRGRSD